ncbi:hypothetical protein M501DRAFT_1018202 [Patellaria atrata CBS 101060]|uniref:Uncharacterized protein n=1 Tax=Patellaria atrata CBS 101060 TaxID=1346257 RepID=A0A9P4S740_9PEZI|nr:hypothetical protein M501DRAFT_1018202 [Patellaria atrata CBS 101060]
MEQDSEPFIRNVLSNKDGVLTLHKPFRAQSRLFDFESKDSGITDHFKNCSSILMEGIVQETKRSEWLLRIWETLSLKALESQMVHETEFATDGMIPCKRCPQIIDWLLCKYDKMDARDTRFIEGSWHERKRLVLGFPSYYTPKGEKQYQCEHTFEVTNKQILRNRFLMEAWMRISKLAPAEGHEFILDSYGNLSTREYHNLWSRVSRVYDLICYECSEQARAELIPYNAVGIVWDQVHMDEQTTWHLKLRFPTEIARCLGLNGDTLEIYTDIITYPGARTVRPRAP